MSERNTFTVRGGVTGEDSEYGAGVRFYDTVSDIARAWKQANPQDRRSHNQVQDWIIRTNNIRDARGRDCTGVRREFAVIHPNQVLTLPPGNPVRESELHYDCPPERRTPPPAPVPPETPPPQVQPQAEAPLLAQFTPAMAGAVDLGYSYQRANFFYGVPPRDAAARGESNPDRLRGGALRPGQMEGQHLRLRERDDATGALPEGQQNLRIYAGRARNQELTYRPQANYIWRDGQLVPNRRFNQKLEENVGAAIDGQGRLVEVVQGGALISLPRRNNPYHSGIFTNHDTARNVIGQWNATGEAITVLTYYNAIQDRYPQIAERFLNGSEAPNAQDAERLLQLNVQTALSPVVWSVSSRGVPVGNPAAISEAMDQVFNSPRFAALSAEEQARLRSTYQPLQAQVGNPDALFQAAGGREGVRAMYNPLQDLAVERAQVGHIRSRYFDGLGADEDRRPAGVSREEFRRQQAEQVGLRYASEMQDAGIRTPSHTERLIGTGVAFNEQRQSADAIRTARQEAIGRIYHQPELLDDVISHVVNTPGALQKVTDPLFHSTRGNARDNRRILSFQSDAEADRFSRQTAEQLGGERFRDRLEYRGQSIFNQVLNRVTLGIATPGANRNQNRGIADGFPEAVRERWLNGTDADREQIRTAFRNVISRADNADRNGVGYASASILTSLDPRLAEYRNDNERSETYRRIETGLNGLPLDVLVQRENATAYLGAQVEQGVERRVMAGENIRTADDDAIRAAVDGNGRVRVDGSDVAAVTALDVDAARQAREAGAAIRGTVLADANNPGLIGQGQTDRQVVVATAAAEPTGFSMLTLRTLASGNLNAASQRNLRAYIETVDDGNRDASRYADILQQRARQLRAAGSNPEARAAVEQAAVGDLNAFFASESRRPGGHRAAVNRLASLISEDGAVSAEFTTQYRALAQSLQAGSPGNGLSREQYAQLQARIANARTPEEARELLAAFQAELAQQGQTGASPSVNAGGANPSVNAGGANSSVNAGGANPSVNAGGNPDVNAGNPSVNAGGANPSVNAGGANPSVNAGGANPSVNAGGNPDVNAGANPSVNAGGANPSVNAGGANPSVNAGGANPSVNAGGANATLNSDQINALSQLAGQNLNAGQLNAAIDSILSSTNAGSSGLNAMTSAQRDQLLSLTATTSSPEELRSRLSETFAGHRADVNATNAHVGINWQTTLGVISAVTGVSLLETAEKLIPIPIDIPICCPQVPRPGEGIIPGR